MQTGGIYIAQKLLLDQTMIISRGTRPVLIRMESGFSTKEIPINITIKSIVKITSLGKQKNQVR